MELLQCILFSSSAVAPCSMRPAGYLLGSDSDPWQLQLLFEEFGKWLNASANATMVDRDVTFSTIFDESQAIMNRPGTALKGLGRPFSPPLLCAVYSTGKHK